MLWGGKPGEGGSLPAEIRESFRKDMRTQLGLEVKKTRKGRRERTFIPRERHIQGQRPQWQKNMVGTESQHHVGERDLGMLWAPSLQ